MRALPLLVTYESKASVVHAMASELGLSDGERELALDLFQAQLPPLSDKRWLPFLFGVSPKIIGAMITRGDSYYRRFRIRKRTGGFREIVTPRRFLKTIQRWLLVHVFEKIPVHDAAHGFIQGRNIFTNAEAHLDNRNLISVDIRDFFPSVSFRSVVEIVEEHFSFPREVNHQISGLCTLDGALPQGAPTSPVLANAAFRSVDIELARLADEWNATYTRYADDIAMSADIQFTESHLEGISEVIEAGGFSINQEKSRICGIGERQMIAGVVVNEAGYPPRERRRIWRAMFHRASLHPHEFVDRVERLEGIAAFVHQYDPEKAEEYWQVASEVRKTISEVAG